MPKKLKVVELFAGVGGFRIGLEGYPRKNNSPYEVVWSNQWEPSTKTQHANLVYEARWPDANHSGQDIALVPTEDIPDHDLLVGGFPCQDYSVATTLKNSQGLIGKKGVLWWQIHRILEEKKSKRPKYIFLENVDRLLKSPASQRGRDFAVILSSLNALGYAVEWKVINAADYGFPQRRRRVFIVGYHKSTELFKQLRKAKDKKNWSIDKGVIGSAFQGDVISQNSSKGDIEADLVSITNKFNLNGKSTPFLDTGVMVSGKFWSYKTKAVYQGPKTTLGDILEPPRRIPKEFKLDKSSLKKWEYLKGAKKEKRQNKAQGFTYNYSEGSMIFPDPLDKPSRTIITGEGGVSPSRFKHVVKIKGTLRRLVPVELERLNMFPDNHTKLSGITDSKRAFFMGNALVIGVVEQIGKELASRVD